MTAAVLFLLAALLACIALGWHLARRRYLRTGHALLQRQRAYYERQLADTRTLLNDALAAQRRAEDACELLRIQTMGGAAVLRHTRPDPHRWADPVLDIVRTERGGLAFTDGEWARARARYDAVAPELPASLA